MEAPLTRVNTDQQIISTNAAFAMLIRWGEVRSRIERKEFNNDRQAKTNCSSYFQYFNKQMLYGSMRNQESAKVNLEDAAEPNENPITYKWLPN